MSAHPDDDAEIVAFEDYHSEGGRYGHRAYQRPDGTGWDEYWGSRIEDWGTRVFASLEQAARWVNTRQPLTPHQEARDGDA